jgi:hypothetical protein
VVTLKAGAELPHSKTPASEGGRYKGKKNEWDLGASTYRMNVL